MALYHDKSAKDFGSGIAFFCELNFSQHSASDHVGSEKNVGP